MFHGPRYRKFEFAIKAIILLVFPPSQGLASTVGLCCNLLSSRSSEGNTYLNKLRTF